MQISKIKSFIGKVIFIVDGYKNIAWPTGAFEILLSNFSSIWEFNLL